MIQYFAIKIDPVIYYTNHYPGTSWRHSRPLFGPWDLLDTDPEMDGNLCRPLYVCSDCGLDFDILLYALFHSVLCNRISGHDGGHLFHHPLLHRPDEFRHESSGSAGYDRCRFAHVMYPRPTPNTERHCQCWRVREASCGHRSRPNTPFCGSNRHL